MKRQSGMTLIEVLVAMAIFAIMGAVASLLLRQTLDNSELLGDRMDRLQSIQRTMTALSSEVLQAAPRPVRAGLGNDEPALQSSFSAEFALQLTHNGWPNSAGVPRSTQRRTAYRIEDDELIRYHWNVLDRTVSNVPITTVLLDEVDSLTFRFLQQNGDWTDQWPPVAAGATANSSALPRAVEILLVLPDEGELTRVVEVAQ
ncbi:MAG: type II secretion system minor pseudopilin GspJ [Gammaproteobacteria bacterium]|nr:type II secretion system minor pseudopilin GspJ [Gammaproteobacteria bacterium]NNF48646.1 type II secretion system minor pseudopilin GspJ [Woeseiaceae bacterium]MBT8095257.1 type II secretion system minor pseudopilin GspJ [Gammaproteobacteria bacterium]MBT8105088.1 type II secretion system minor pseudopilin GspJ [Gammaproteobacteria bacterium]NNK25102.1 type II secretion system minor pseudopilin GspJ [Woeseiaceae bacterium]